MKSIKFYLLLFFQLSAFFCISQTNINLDGRILNQLNQPLPFATIFINGSQIQTIADKNGEFHLPIINPGIYSLTASMVGYSNNTLKLLIKTSVQNINIKLTPKSNSLADIVISNESQRLWKEHLELFKKYFLGETSNAKKCIITNPKVLRFSLNPNNGILSAWASDFILIKNYALGYTIQYGLDEFTFNTLNFQLEYSGSCLFKEMQGDSKQIHKWAKARIETYQGSKMQFFRSVFNHSLAQNGFNLYELKILDKSLWPSDEIIDKKIMFYDSLTRVRELRSLSQSTLALANTNIIGESRTEQYNPYDSLSKYLSMKEMGEWKSPYYRVSVPLKPESILSNVDSNFKTLQLKDITIIDYTKKMEDPDYQKLKSADWKINKLKMGQQSLISIMDPKESRIDINGQFQPKGYYFEGYFTWKRVGDQLPIEYQPDK